MIENQVKAPRRNLLVFEKKCWIWCCGPFRRLKYWLSSRARRRRENLVKAPLQAIISEGFTSMSPTSDQSLSSYRVHEIEKALQDSSSKSNSDDSRSSLEQPHKGFEKKPQLLKQTAHSFPFKKKSEPIF